MTCDKCHGVKRVRGFNAAGEPDAVLCSCVKCRKCEDTKQIIEQDEKGRHLPAKPCSCVEDGRVPRYMAEANIPPSFRDAEIGNFDVQHQYSHESQGVALFRAMDYANQSAEKLGGDGIIFTGGFGVGKTHLAVGILKHLIETQRRPGLFCDCKALIPAIQDSFDRKDVSAYQVRFPVLTRDIVLLDDLGAGYLTEWSQEELAAIITHRYNHGLPTIITTNYAIVDPRPEAERVDLFRGRKGGLNGEGKTLGDCIGGRAFSRIFQMCTDERMVKIESKMDFRRMVKNQPRHSWR